MENKTFTKIVFWIAMAAVTIWVTLFALVTDLNSWECSLWEECFTEKLEIVQDQAVIIEENLEELDFD